jgi:hypothetical protein
MHERRGPQRRLARITEVGEPRSPFTKRRSVSRRQLHDKIVRVLSIDERLTVKRHTSLKQLRLAAARQSKRLET